MERYGKEMKAEAFCFLLKQHIIETAGGTAGGWCQAALKIPQNLFLASFSQQVSNRTGSSLIVDGSGFCG